MAAEYNQMNQYRGTGADKERKLDVEQPNSHHTDGFMIDARALMQAKHDSTEVFLTRFYSSWEFQLYYFVSTGLALAMVIFIFIADSMGRLG